MKYIKTFEQHSVVVNEELFGMKTKKEFMLDGKDLPNLKKKYANILDANGKSISEATEQPALCTLQEGQKNKGQGPFNVVYNGCATKLGMNAEQALEATLKLYQWGKWNNAAADAETKFDKNTLKFNFVKAEGAGLNAKLF